MTLRNKKVPMNFKTMAQVDVPQGRNGKHRQIITQILADLEHLPTGGAIRVPLEELEESKENVRSALTRAAHKGTLNVATASDAEFLYVWNKTE